MLCARDAVALDSAAAGIRAAGGQADVFAADLRDAAAPAALVEFAVERCQRLDILVNNAGATARGDFRVLTDEQWMDGYALKLFGAVRLCRAAWPYLETSQGSVVNIAGIGGRTPGAEFSIGGSVNAINPGSIRTDRLQKRLERLAAERGIDLADAERRFVAQVGATRIGEPDDIAALVAFVVGPEGRFLHGAVIDVDGGATKSL